jgi:uncharacterized protein
MKHRAVLDTNVYASALMKPTSNPGKVLKKIIENPSYEIVISELILEEMQRVLFHPKVRKYIQGSNEELKHWIQAIGMVAHVVSPKIQDEVIIHEDPDDDKFVLAALEGKAKLIITGDKHLLKLKKYQNIAIITPQEFNLLTRVLDKGSP